MNDLVAKLGNLDMDKGEVRKGHTLFAWDAVQECSQSRCPIHTQCAYDKKGKCLVQLRYVETIMLTVTKTYKYLDDVQLTKIGIQLLPLYSHLVRLKIIERGITLENIVESVKGKKHIHPIFKEIRQTLLMINMMWRDLLIRPINLMMPDPTDPDAPVDANDDPRIINGDPTYYRKLAEKGRLRKKETR